MSRGLLGRVAGLATVSALLLGIAIYAEGRLSGWSALATEHPGSPDDAGIDLRVEEGGLGAPRWFHGVAPLEASMTLRGLHLQYPFPYSIGHQPILIPWRELRVTHASLEGDDAQLILAVSAPEGTQVSLRGDVAAVVREWLAPARD